MVQLVYLLVSRILSALQSPLNMRHLLTVLCVHRLTAESRRGSIQRRIIIIPYHGINININAMISRALCAARISHVATSNNRL
jgi:hypothetical protein